MDAAVADSDPSTEVTFFEAAGTNRCLWPLRGRGELMVVCGARKALDDPAYCLRHRQLSVPPSCRR